MALKITGENTTCNAISQTSSFQEYQPLSTLILEGIPHPDTVVENAYITAAAVLFVEPQIYESTETINLSMNDTNQFVVTI